MKTIAKFEKVSYEQFKKDLLDKFPEIDENSVQEIYDNIKLPKRATVGSAGYDFYTPVGFVLRQGETINIPTGIRVRIEDGYFLGLYPRSSLGFKYRLQLNNTVGIVDSDYYRSTNEGHIFIKVTNDSKSFNTLTLHEGDSFAQGIFTEFFLAEEEEVTEVRDGGFGSTNNKGGI